MGRPPIVVGYLNDDTAIAGKNQYVPSFTTVGYNTTRLTSIKVTKPDSMTGDLTDDANALQTINQDGDIVDTYLWEGVSAGRGQPKVWDWYKATATGTVKITQDNDVYIPQGQGFVLSSEVAGLKLMSSGEVEMADVVTNTATVAGKNLIGNPFAVAITLTKVSLDKPEGATADLTDDANALQTIDQDGNIVDTYLWEGVSAGRGQPKVWDWYRATATGTEKITTENDVTILPGGCFKLSAELNNIKVIMKQN